MTEGLPWAGTTIATPARLLVAPDVAQVDEVEDGADAPLGRAWAAPACLRRPRGRQKPQTGRQDKQEDQEPKKRRACRAWAPIRFHGRPTQAGPLSGPAPLPRACTAARAPVTRAAPLPRLGDRPDHLHASSSFLQDPRPHAPVVSLLVPGRRYRMMAKTTAEVSGEHGKRNRGDSEGVRSRSRPRDHRPLERGVSRRRYRARLRQRLGVARGRHPLGPVHGQDGQSGHSQALPEVPHHRGLRLRRTG